MRSRRLFFAAGLAGVLVASSARANGRFPRAERLIEDPANPNRLLLAATYGLVTSHDGGGTWYFTCEALFAGSSDYSQDPILDLVAGGSALVDVQAAINRSSDDCAWTQALGTSAAGDETIADFAVDRAHGSIVVAAVVNDDGSSITLRESPDAGTTWAPMGTPLPLSAFYTVDLDPTDPTHVYASGLSPAGDPVLVSSVDNADTWTTMPITGASIQDLPYIAAIDPNNPNGIYIRTDSFALDAQGNYAANDALLYSADAGSTWTELIRKHAKLLGFALSPDGTGVLAGYGIDDTSTQIAASVDASQTGLFEAKTSDWQFAPVFTGQPVTCLTWTSLGTYACTQLPASCSLEELVLFPDGTLAPGAGLSASRSLMRLSEIDGNPPGCSAVDAVCDWSSLCVTFNACPQASPVATSCDAGDEASTDDGATDSGGRSTALDANAPPAAGPAEGVGAQGCGCRLTKRPGDTARGLAVLAAIAPWLARRRRRRHAEGATRS